MIDLEKLKAGLKSHDSVGSHCKGCPYEHSDPMLDPRIDPDYGKHVIEACRKCRDELIADSAEYIEQLEERIAIMSEGFEWTKTCDKLPKANKTLWLFIKGKYVVEGHLMEVSNGVCWWCIHLPSHITNFEDVTHWQYQVVPEPPKEGEPE